MTGTGRQGVKRRFASSEDRSGLTLQTRLDTVLDSERSGSLGAREDKVEGGLGLSVLGIGRLMVAREEVIVSTKSKSKSAKKATTDLLGPSGNGNGSGGLASSSGESLPELFGDERHEGVKKTESRVEAGVEGLLSGLSGLERGRGVGHGLGSLLLNRTYMMRRQRVSNRNIWVGRERGALTM